VAFGKKINCEATTEYHLETVAQISVDDDRKIKHWFLVFPQGTHFDNVALSGDPFTIKKTVHGVLQTFDGSNTAYRTVTANWRIADKFGGRLLEPEKEEVINHDIF
jgi:hypothetical protein